MVRIKGPPKAFSLCKVHNWEPVPYLHTGFHALQNVGEDIYMAGCRQIREPRTSHMVDAQELVKFYCDYCIQMHQAVMPQDRQEIITEA